MEIKDVILVRNKLRAEGMTVKNLASKIHTSPTKLENILIGKLSSPTLEKRIIKWLERK